MFRPDPTGRHVLLRGLRLHFAVLARAAAFALAACLSVAVVVGCGGSSSGSSSEPRARKATLILDFVPNAVHAGVYRALAAGYYSQEGIDLRVVQPSATTDTLKLIDAHSAQFGLADGSDVAALIAKGGDAQAIMAIVQRPLGGLIASASERLRSPADLQGRTVGVTGVPSDTAVLDTEVRHGGGDPKKVHVVTIGFGGAQALAARRVAAFTGFIPDDGVQLQVSGHPITAFALDRNGGPAYPGLVAFTTRGLIASDPTLVRGFVAATVHGYEDTLADPARSLEDLLHANPMLQAKFTHASLNAYLPLFAARGSATGAPSGASPGASAGASSGATGGAVSFGTLQARNIEAMSSWMLANGLIDVPIGPARYGTNRFLPGDAR